jgi:predicted RNA-binding Zn-ribbon protein involved in translation (DUF1610 family)
MRVVSDAKGVRRVEVDCTSCGRSWQSGSRSGRTTCPECGRRVYIPVALRREAYEPPPVIRSDRPEPPGGFFGRGRSPRPDTPPMPQFPVGAHAHGTGTPGARIRTGAGAAVPSALAHTESGPALLETVGVAVGWRLAGRARRGGLRRGRGRPCTARTAHAAATHTTGVEYRPSTERCLAAGADQRTEPVCAPSAAGAPSAVAIGEQHRQAVVSAHRSTARPTERGTRMGIRHLPAVRRERHRPRRGTGQERSAMSNPSHNDDRSGRMD